MSTTTLVRTLKTKFQTAKARSKIFVKTFSQRYFTAKRSLLFIGLTYGILGYYYLKKNPRFKYQLSYSRLISKVMGKVATIKIPVTLRKPLFSAYAKVYKVNLEEAEKKVEEFKTFQEFFTRKIHPRPVEEAENHLVSPADSKILSFSTVEDDKAVLVKGRTYKLGEFLTGLDNYELRPEVIDGSIKKAENKEKTKLYHCIFYLAPGDYHRYHSPAEIVFKKRNHVTGFLYSVKESVIAKRPEVYDINERVGLFGDWKFGFFSMVLVGATNVGSMTLNFDKELRTNWKVHKKGKEVQKVNVFDYISNEPVDLIDTGKKKIVKEQKEQAKPDLTGSSLAKGIKVRKGEEVGRFNLGSTVVLVFEAPDNFVWTVKPGEKVKYGQSVGYIPVPEAPQPPTK